MQEEVVDNFQGSVGKLIRSVMAEDISSLVPTKSHGAARRSIYAPIVVGRVVRERL